MRKADFKARVKKLEMVNKVLAGEWEQTIKIILDEIELNDENLLELRQFKPNEMVSVEIKPVQVSLFNNSQSSEEADKGAPKPGPEEAGGSKPFMYIEEEDTASEGPGRELFENENIIKEWSFNDKK